LIASGEIKTIEKAFFNRLKSRGHTFIPISDLNRFYDEKRLLTGVVSGK